MMNDNNFAINGVNFKVHKIDAFKQFHIVRRMAPILADLIPVANKLSKMKDAGDEQFEALAPIMNGLAKLTDEESNKVLIGLLSAIEMQQGEGGPWARLVNGESLMFQNLELPVMLQAAGRAFMFNMAGFFAVLPSASPGGKSKPKSK